MTTKQMFGDFIEVRSEPMYESPAHEENGLSIGDCKIFRLSAALSAELSEQKPAGRSFQSNASRDARWFHIAETATQSAPEQVTFKRGLKSDRWYASALYF
jgi:hypothetical protein